MSSADHRPKGGAGEQGVDHPDFAQPSQLDFDIAFFDHILQRDPDYIDVLRCQGELLTRKGLHQQALEVDRRLSRMLPGDCVVRYNLACSLALAGFRSEAIETLRVALEAGYDDLEHLVCDNDLDSLRDDPAYQALLRRFAVLAPSDTLPPTDPP